MQFLNGSEICPEKRQDALWCDVQRYGAMVQWIAIQAIVGYFVHLPIPRIPLPSKGYSPIPKPLRCLRMRLNAENASLCQNASAPLSEPPDARAYEWAPCQVL